MGGFGASSDPLNDDQRDMRDGVDDLLDSLDNPDFWDLYWLFYDFSTPGPVHGPAASGDGS